MLFLKVVTRLFYQAAGKWREARRKEIRGMERNRGLAREPEGEGDRQSWETGRKKEPGMRCKR